MARFHFQKIQCLSQLHSLDCLQKPLVSLPHNKLWLLSLNRFCCLVTIGTGSILPVFLVSISPSSSCVCEPSSWHESSSSALADWLMLRCIALRCIALHCVALHCVALHCVALHCVALHCVALHYVALHWSGTSSGRRLPSCVCPEISRSTKTEDKLRKTLSVMQVSCSSWVRTYTARLCLTWGGYKENWFVLEPIE